MISNYKFGLITINEKQYNHDVEVRWPGQQVLDWWRKESHVIDLEDIERALEQGPDIIIIGTGAAGIAKITERARQVIEEKGVKLIIEKTMDAVKIFNDFKEKSEKEKTSQKIIGLFHLTC